MISEEALKKMREIQNTMEQRASESAIAAQTYCGCMSLFQAAALTGDENAMQTQRDALHACLDTILDNGAICAERSRAMEEVRRNHEDL